MHKRSSKNFFLVILLPIHLFSFIITKINSFSFVITKPRASSYKRVTTTTVPTTIHSSSKKYARTFSIPSESFSTTHHTTSTTILMMSNINNNNNNHNHLNIPLTKLTSFANSFAAVHGLQVETKQQQSSSSSTSSSSSSSYQCAPISLLPNVFPLKSFQQAKTVAPAFNLLVDQISRNGKFLNDTLAGGDDHDDGNNDGNNNKNESSSVVSKDEYTKKILELYNDIYHSKNKKGVHDDDDVGAKPNFAHLADRLGIQRSDYMLNPSSSSPSSSSSSSSSSFELKQVELNTIAASFGGLATNVAKLHSILTNRFRHELKDWIDSNTKKVMGSDYIAATTADDEGENDGVNGIGVPHNHALEKLPFAMKLAHERYIERFCSTNNDTKDSAANVKVPLAILFVVQDGETNTVDQRMLEFELWDKHNIPVVRMSLTKAHSHLKLDTESGSLYVLRDDNDNNDDNVSTAEYEVSLVYFRAGYAPTDYPDGYNGIEWMARETIERSKATKCPSLGYHLAGTKKVQQQLARPGVLEELYSLPSSSSSSSSSSSNDSSNCCAKDIQNMRDAFAGLYSLGNDAMKEDYDAVKDAITGSEGKYVLKPQREGGGYNFYGERLASKIKENVKEDEKGALILGDDLAEFILMQRLFPPKQTAVLLRAGVVEGSGESISELGCFGTILQSYDGKTTLHNEYAGFLLRTKFENVDEGGVASGFATLSSPYLC